MEECTEFQVRTELDEEGNIIDEECKNAVCNLQRLARRYRKECKMVREEESNTVIFSVDAKGILDGIDNGSRGASKTDQMLIEMLFATSYIGTSHSNVDGPFERCGDYGCE